MTIAFIKIYLQIGNFKSIKKSLAGMVPKNSIIKGLLDKTSDSTIMLVTPISSMAELAELIYEKIHSIEGVSNTITSIATVNDSDFKKLFARKMYISFTYCKSASEDNKSINGFEESIKEQVKNNILVAKVSPTEFYVLNEIDNEFKKFDENMYNSALVINRHKMVAADGQGHCP